LGTMQKIMMLQMLLLGFVALFAQSSSRTIPEHHDLSTTVISPDTAPTVPGHYVYTHAFSYDLQGNHFDVHETGTMSFDQDGSALDSARQVYVATLKDGGTATIEFDYYSPSRWRLEGEDFHFSGIKERFRMAVVDMKTKDCDSSRAAELAQEIINVVSGSIEYEYKFHLDTLTANKLQWSFTYRDGHRDTWEFYR